MRGLRSTTSRAFANAHPWYAYPQRARRKGNGQRITFMMLSAGLQIARLSEGSSLRRDSKVDPLLRAVHVFVEG